MSLNVNNIGVPIAYIKNNPKYQDVVFSVSETESAITNGFEEFKITEGSFQVLPNAKKRNTVLIAGSEGAGKSYWISQYIAEYRKIYKKHPIYLFSEKEQDACLDDIKGLKRIELTNLEDPSEQIPYSEFSNSAVIFDDCDAFTGKLRKYLDDLRDKLLKNARSNNTTVIVSSHSFAGRDLQPTFINCKIIVFFLSDWNRSLKYMVDNFIGLDKKQIDALKSNKSRWCAYVKSTFPNVIVQEKNIMSLEGLQNF